MIFKVKVDCWYKQRKGLGNGLSRRIFVLEAEDSGDAMAKGAEIANSTAEMFRTWLDFIPREAASVQLPLELKL
jgi:hypothetical protein